MSKISVAMTTYNGEQFVLEQLCSLLSQTRKPDEVIICDDASTDATVSILRTFLKNHDLQNWRILENPQNLGYIANFRRAIASASGDIVFLCDQDDVWKADKIARMVQVLEENPEITALVSGYALIDSSGRSCASGEKKLYTPSRRGSDGSGVFLVRSGKVLYSNMAQGCTGAYRRGVTEAYCGAKNCVTIPHDWALNMLAYQQGGLYFLEEELVCYRIHENNTTGLSDAEQAVRCRIPRLREYAACIEDAANLPLPDSAKKEIADIAAFTDHRIRWLQSRKPGVWLKGLLAHFPLVTGTFFFQYMKDFVLVLLGRIPAEQKL